MGKNKKLIILLIILVLILCGYYIAYEPIISKGKKLETQINGLNAEIAKLEPDYKKMADIEAEIESLKIANSEKLAKYPARLSEEFGFRLLFDIEAMSGVEFKNVSFGEVEVIASETPSEQSFEDGENPKNSEVKEDNRQEKPEEGYAQSVTTRTVTDYEGLKQILRFISNYKNKVVIENLNISDIDGTTDLAMDMQLQMIGISSSPNAEMPKFDKVEQGKDVFFDILYGEELDQKKTDASKAIREERKANNGKMKNSTANKEKFADIFIAVHSVKADAEAQMIGMVDVNPASSLISSDINKQLEVGITIETYGDKLVATYYMNGEERSETFPVGDMLELNIYSAERIDGKDLSSISLNINNTTTHKLYINLIDEDEEWPRVEFANMKGDYEIR